MPDRTKLIPRLGLASQVLLKDDPRGIPLTGDAEGTLADEVRLAQSAPESAVREFNRLFLDPLGARCHFWQSVYAEEPRLMGPAHHSAMQWFRNYGVEPQGEGEPADHLALLMIFYARLIESGEAEETLKAFHREHLSWAREFAAKLQAEAQHPLFLALAREIQSIVAV